MRNFLYDLLSYLSNMKEEMLLKHLDIKLFLTYYDIITWWNPLQIEKEKLICTQYIQHTHPIKSSNIGFYCIHVIFHTNVKLQYC